MTECPINETTIKVGSQNTVVGFFTNSGIQQQVVPTAEEALRLTFWVAKFTGFPREKIQVVNEELKG